MLVVNEDFSIYVTRGDSIQLSVSAVRNGTAQYEFEPGDVVRIKVFEKKSCDNVVLQKDFGVEERCQEVNIYLESKDTKFGDVISKPTDYWYEIELNPNTNPQTIIGYDDENGAKLFRLYPEGGDVEEVEIEEEDIPVVDEELDLTSSRPVQNQAIARVFFQLTDEIAMLREEIESMKQV